MRFLNTTCMYVRDLHVRHRNACSSSVDSLLSVDRLFQRSDIDVSLQIFCLDRLLDTYQFELTVFIAAACAGVWVYFFSKACYTMCIVSLKRVHFRCLLRCVSQSHKDARGDHVSSAAQQITRIVPSTAAISRSYIHVNAGRNTGIKDSRWLMETRHSRARNSLAKSAVCCLIQGHASVKSPRSTLTDFTVSSLIAENQEHLVRFPSLYALLKGDAVWKVSILERLLPLPLPTFYCRIEPLRASQEGALTYVTKTAFSC